MFHASNQMLEAGNQITDHKGGRPELYQAALETLKKCKTDEPVLEVGSWSGGSSLILMAAIDKSGRRCSLVTVDPYAPNVSLLKRTRKPAHVRKRFRQFNLAYSVMCGNMVSAIQQTGLYHVHYKMTDSDFIEHVYPNVAFYLNSKPIRKPKFNFIHLDGGHEMESEKQQMLWAVKHLTPKGNIVVDDVHLKRPDKLEQWLKKNYGGRKISKQEWCLK